MITVLLQLAQDVTLDPAARNARIKSIAITVCVVVFIAALLIRKR